MAIKARATTDMLIGSVSQVCLNHIGLLIIDEIQNVVKNKHGMQLRPEVVKLLSNNKGVGRKEK